MSRRKWLPRLALVVLVLAAEVAGRSLAFRIDVGRHVGRFSYVDAAYYPFVLVAVKVGVALTLARLAWRFFQARRVASLLGSAPRLRVRLSWRLWLLSFVGTTAVFLLQTNAEHAAVHSSALPVFAVLSVLTAVVWRGVARWLADYESYARESVAHAWALAAGAPTLVPRRPRAGEVAPRRLHGVCFESRPPPVPA